LQDSGKGQVRTNSRQFRDQWTAVDDVDVRRVLTYVVTMEEQFDPG